MQEWKKVKEEPVRAGFRRMLKRLFVLPNGKEQDFDIKHEGPAACVLALTTNHTIVLAKQYRPGPERVLMEMPGGMVEENEDPLAAIQRELLEETGYRGDIEFVGTCFDCAYSTMERHCYVAKNCTKIQEPMTDETEFVEIVEMSLEDFRSHLRSGLLTDVEMGYLALDHLGLL